MSNRIFFQVQRGSVVSDCMEETYQFISNNLRYLHESLIPIRDEILENSEFTFISYEDNWTFAASIDKVELRRVAQGSGVIQEGSQCSYDEIIEDLNS